MLSSMASHDLSGEKVKKFNNGWTQEQEVLLAKWSDFAACYRWLHDRTEKKLSRKNNCITIPVIILSTITGTLSVGLNGLVGNSPDIQHYAQVGIGAVSLFTGILTTLGNFFRYAQNSEAHRVAAVSWGKLNRSISVELAQRPDDRMDSLEFLAICREILDRLIEQSPAIPDDIINKFEIEFESQEDLARPDILNNLEHTSVYDNSKSRMKSMIAEVAMNLKHKKKLLREEILPDLDNRMKLLVDKSMKDLEARIKEFNDRDSSIPKNLRIKLGEMTDKIRDIYVTSPGAVNDVSSNDVVINIGRSPTSNEIKKRAGVGSP